MPRSYDRSPADHRPVSIEPGFMRTATGSCLYSQGETRIICTASISSSVPKWLEGKGRGWVTAEYAMLPASTGERKERDSKKGRPDGRSTEIQRLIGRALRGVVDLTALPDRSVYVDCDVLQADGGTRCASITGGYVALRLATSDSCSRRASSSAIRSRARSLRSPAASSAASCSATSTTPRTRPPRSTPTSS